MYRISNDTVVNWQLAAFHKKFHQQAGLGNSQNQTRACGGRPLRRCEERGHRRALGPVSRSAARARHSCGEKGLQWFFKVFFF